MRNLEKSFCPDVLSRNHERWFDEWQEEPKNATRRFRYREREIKLALLDETSSKCIYCESKLGHNTPGDVEHLLPSAVHPDLHFVWENLSIACAECNRRKGIEVGVLNPYSDEVEERVLHHGPLSYWMPGDEAAEITIKILKLHNGDRLPLVLRKIEKLSEVADRLQRYFNEQNATLKALLFAELAELAAPSSEFSSMVITFLLSNNIDV